MVSGGVTTVYIGGYYEWATGGATRKYYYHAGERVLTSRGCLRTQWVAMRDDGTLYWLLADHLGSTNVSFRDSDGTTATQRYYVWAAIRSTTGTLPTDYAFTGQRLDASGLLDYSARWYDPYLNHLHVPTQRHPEGVTVGVYTRKIIHGSVDASCSF